MAAPAQRHDLGPVDESQSAEVAVAEPQQRGEAPGDHTSDWKSTMRRWREG